LSIIKLRTAAAPRRAWEWGAVGGEPLLAGCRCPLAERTTQAATT